MLDNNNEYVSYEFEPVEEKAPRKKKNIALKVAALAVVCAIVGGAGGVGLTTMIMNRQQSSESSESAVAANGEDSAPVSPDASKNRKNSAPVDKSTVNALVSTSSGEKNMTPQEVYNQNVHAVVGINVTGTKAGTNVWGYATPFAASGSGFIISEDGYIVTNNHVIESADDITVSLFDGSSYEAELVGTYSSNDIALLKVDAKDLPTVTIGDSSMLAVGDEVAAVGNPLGQLTFSLTVGYVSALDRSINTDGTPINMLQTDAAINSGNSGGPLFDMSGRVVGITTAKASSNAYSSGASVEGIGFAIPINDVVDVINDLKEHGYVTGEAYLGVTLKELDAETVRYYSLPMGVFVDSVEPDSCADKAGVQKGDIITSMNGTAVESYNELALILRRSRAGENVELTVYREGEIRTLKGVLDEKPAEPEPEPEEQTQPQPATSSGDAYRMDPFSFFDWGF